MKYREIIVTNIKKNEPRKRWFTNKVSDLFIWLNDDNEILSYQLTYNKPAKEKAMIWRKNSKVIHQKVDDGANTLGHPMTPIIIDDTSFDPESVSDLIGNDTGELETWIADFIIDTIKPHV